MDDTVLTARHRKYDLYLEEYSDHILFLKNSMRVIASFNQSNVSPEQIRAAADKYLMEIDAP